MSDWSAHRARRKPCIPQRPEEVLKVRSVRRPILTVPIFPCACHNSEPLLEDLPDGLTPGKRRARAVQRSEAGLSVEYCRCDFLLTHTERSVQSRHGIQTEEPGGGRAGAPRG